MPHPVAPAWRAASRIAVALTAVAALGACSDGDGTSASTLPPITTGVTTTAASTTTVPATPAATTEPATTTEAPNTFPPNGSTDTTLPPPTLSGQTIELHSPLMVNPFVLERVGVFEELVVYDGESVDGDFALRCIAVGHDGGLTWSEWCALPGDAASFVVVDGSDPWVVDVGAEPLDVTMAKMPSTWAVTTSGCTDPIVMLIAAADIAPAVATDLACVADAAFLGYGSVFMQPGPADGGGSLLLLGEEGWNAQGRGTSMPCDGFADGVDRCDQFGVESEMFEALTPIPSPEMIGPQADFVAVREVTADMRAAADASAAEDPDVDTVAEAVLAALPGDREPGVVRHDEVSFKRYSLLIADVPAEDDSIRSTTWAVWITTDNPELPSAVHRAYAWDNCARGVADPATCV